MLGRGCIPDSIEPQILSQLQLVDPNQLVAVRASINKAVASMPPHFDYLRRQGLYAAR